MHLMIWPPEGAIIPHTPQWTLNTRKSPSEALMVRDASQFLSSSELYMDRGVKGETLLKVKGNCGNFKVGRS